MGKRARYGFVWAKRGQAGMPGLRVVANNENLKQTIDVRLGGSLALPRGPSRSPTPETRTPKPDTRNPKPETRNPKPETRLGRSLALPKGNDSCMHPNQTPCNPWQLVTQSSTA